MSDFQSQFPRAAREIASREAELAAQEQRQQMIEEEQTHQLHMDRLQNAEAEVGDIFRQLPEAYARCQQLAAGLAPQLVELWETLSKIREQEAAAKNILWQTRLIDDSRLPVQFAQLKEQAGLPDLADTLPDPATPAQLLSFTVLVGIYHGSIRPGEVGPGGHYVMFGPRAK